MVEKWQIVHRRVFHISFMSKCRSEGTNKSDGSFFTKQNTLETFNILDNSSRQCGKWAVFVSSVTLYCLFLRVNIVRRKRIRSPYVRNHFFSSADSWRFKQSIVSLQRVWKEMNLSFCVNVEIHPILWIAFRTSQYLRWSDFYHNRGGSITMGIMNKEIHAVKNLLWWREIPRRRRILSCRKISAAVMAAPKFTACGSFWHLRLIVANKRWSLAEQSLQG